MPGSGLHVNNNPEWILGDTDALLQLIAADRLGPLKRLRSDYGIQTVIAESVEVELRNIIRGLRFKDVQHILTKALDTKLLLVLDQSALQSLVGAHAHKIYQDIETEGLRLKSLGVGDGEAYTHAGSMRLKMPVLSNDRKAIKILLQ